MQFIRLFGSSIAIWTLPLIVVLLVSAPLQSRASDFNGEITSINKIGRSIKINGNSYTVALQAEIRDAFSDTTDPMSISDLEVGQYVEFDVDGKIIQKLRIFKGGPPM